MSTARESVLLRAVLRAAGACLHRCAMVLLVGILFPNANMAETKSDSAAPPTAFVAGEDSLLHSGGASRNASWVNSLNMGFVRIGDVMFSVYETRIEDYLVFVRATGRRWRPMEWQGQGHPAVNVSWHDAIAFCAWLTEKERKEKLIRSDQRYRLPTDAEWSVAAGLSHEEGISPMEKNLSSAELEVYPWSGGWPPPPRSENLSSSLKGYEGDNYPKTSPVGTFAANPLGLFDLGGNVSEWCEDALSPWSSHEGVVRGGDFSSPFVGFLRSGVRMGMARDQTSPGVGVRIVLSDSGSGPGG